METGPATHWLPSQAWLQKGDSVSPFLGEMDHSFLSASTARNMQCLSLRLVDKSKTDIPDLTLVNKILAVSREHPSQQLYCNAKWWLNKATSRLTKKPNSLMIQWHRKKTSWTVLIQNSWAAQCFTILNLFLFLSCQHSLCSSKKTRIVYWLCPPGELLRLW